MSGVVALIVAVTGLIGAVAGIIGLFRKVQAVHVLVNSQLTGMMDRVDQLTAVLHSEGIDIPARPPAPPDTGITSPAAPHPRTGPQ